jgi:hypothetical protein
MRGRTDLDRAAVVLGIVSLVGAALGGLKGKFGFIHLGHHGYLVVLILGVLAAVAGWLGLRLLVLAVGAAFVVAAVVQALLIGRHGDPFGGDGSTVAFWLGLGVGLLALGLTPRSTSAPWPTGTPGEDA